MTKLKQFILLFSIFFTILIFSENSYTDKNYETNISMVSTNSNFDIELIF